MFVSSRGRFSRKTEKAAEGRRRNQQCAQKKGMGGGEEGFGVIAKKEGEAEKNKHEKKTAKRAAGKC